MLSHFHLHGELRFSGVMGRGNGLLGLREDDDDLRICVPGMHLFHLFTTHSTVDCISDFSCSSVFCFNYFLLF